LSPEQQSKIHLQPIPADRLPQLMEIMLPAYAAERAASDHISLDDATAFARRQYAQLLPEGINTPWHRFVAIVPKTDQIQVGFVWYYIEQQRREAFIYELWIHEPFRRKGFATAALNAVAAEVRQSGCERLGLNVFATNPGAAALYRKCGFEVVSQHMNKRL